MSSSTDLNAILNQLLEDDKAMKLLLLALLREQSVDKLNEFIKQTEIRTKLAMDNENDHESRQSIQNSGGIAKSILQTIIVEKNASL
ncbi:hypothetical protein ACNY9Y_003137 [Cronobacter dublinensis]